MLIGKFVGISIVILTITLIFPSPTYAYLDPGTGSYFFQILIATILGGFFAVKLFFRKIVDFVKGFLSKDANKKSSAK